MQVRRLICYLAVAEQVGQGGDWASIESLGARGLGGYEVVLQFSFDDVRMSETERSIREFWLFQEMPFVTEPIWREL